jgi:hypothetical protein
VRRRFIVLGMAVAIAGGLPLAAFAQSASPAPSSPAAPASSAPSAPASPAPAQTPPAPAPTTGLPVDVDRIQELAQKRPAVRLDDKQLRFYALVLAKAPKFEDFVGDYDLKNGPTKGGAAMTHQEFLDMVTPRELGELFGSTNGSSFAMLQMAIMNALGQKLIKKAVLDMRAAHNEREVADIRARIDRELAALLRDH